MCACEYVCVCVGVCECAGRGVRGCIGGPLIGMSELHGVYGHGRERKREGVRDKERDREGGRERERAGGRAQSAAAEQVSRCDCVSQRSTNLQERHNTSLDSFPLCALICLGSFYGAFGPRKQSMVALVKMSVLSSFTSCLHFESKFFFPCKRSILLTVCFFSSSLFPFILQVAECRQLAQCQIHLRM